MLKMFSRALCLAFVGVLTVSVPAFSQGQCSEEDFEEVQFCIEDATFACLDQFPACEGEIGGGGDSVVDTLAGELDENCCGLGSESAIIVCLKKAKRGVNKSKKFLPSDVVSGLKAHISERLSAVQSDGECYLDDEEEEEEEEEEF